MEVAVHLHAMLRRYRPETAVGAPHHPFTFTLPSGATVADLATRLGIPDGYVNAAAVNDESVTADTPLHDGDRVNLFPPAAGGS